ncbi:MAG: M50 family metallopeptidase [Verrucomicrobiota bacterium]|nr:M50 family metallopeptidase [Verrucomicrobiota bacterium]
MLPTRQGAFRLFRLAGIEVFLHWSWFLVAVIEIQYRAGSYSSMTWNVLEYLTLFSIVLLHEFGHATACRQVGGQANEIVLWPLGGVAYVAPPPRPGPTLWSIAAGPLVNVVLLPVFYFLGMLSRSAGWEATMPDLHVLLRNAAFINGIILIFNLLPVYPLDGGQILRSLLWFRLGHARSLLVATTIGFVGVAGLVALALWRRDIWIGIIAAFVFANCRGAWMQARAAVGDANRRFDK